MITKWIIGIALVVVVFFAIMLFNTIVMKPTVKWYEKCDKFEEDLMKNTDIERHLKELMELAAYSWHRTTGERVKELAIRYEMKYNVKILQ